MIKAILSFIFLLIPMTSWGAVYYVDYTNGNDSNNGTSLTTPFKTMAPVEGLNFLVAGDHVEILPNNTFVGTDGYFTINSSGAYSNPIVIERYQAIPGTDPIFSGATQTASISGWTGWNAYDAGNHIWQSNVAVPFTVHGVIVDGSYNLLGSENNNEALLQSVSLRYYQDGSGYVYVRLPDNSDPDGHTVEFTGQYIQGTFSGQIATHNGNGSYITFRHIEVYGGLFYAFQSNTPFVRFEDCQSWFSGRESFYFATHAQVAPGANNNTCLRCVAAYGGGNINSGTNAGWGQNITVEGSYTDIVDSTIEYGSMAGMDFLGYATDTPASYDRIINSVVQYNSQRSRQNFDNDGFDPQIYLDGANNIQIINVIEIGNRNLGPSSPQVAQHAIDGVTLSSEHPTTNIPHDVYIHNLIATQNTWYSLQTTELNGSNNPWYNVWVDNATIYGNGGDGGSLISIGAWNSSLGQTLHMYNNIFDQDSGATASIRLPNAGVPDMNNNLYFNDSGSSSAVISANSTTYSLAAWQSYSGQDSNSVYGNPQFINTNSDWHLQRTSLGQSNTSAAIGIGLPNWANPYYNIYNLGTTRTDGIIDSSLTPDVGYHYNLVFGSSNGWNKGFTEQYN